MTVPNLPSLVAEAHRHTPVGCVLGDAEFDSERNHTICRQQLRADSIIPAKRFTSRRATGVRGQMRENFPRDRYARRSLIETVFSVANQNSPAAPPAELSLCKPGRHCCSALLTTSIASGRLRERRGCQQIQISSDKFEGGGVSSTASS